MLIKVLHFWFWVCFFFTVQSSDVTDRKHTTSWIRNHKPLQIYANLHLLWYFYYTFSNTIVALILMILQLHIFYWSILWYSYDIFSCITITLFLLWLLQMVHVFRYKCFNFSNASISFYNCYIFSIQVLLTELSLRDTPNRQTNRRPVTLHILPLSSGWLLCIFTDQVSFINLMD